MVPCDDSEMDRSESGTNPLKLSEEYTAGCVVTPWMVVFSVTLVGSPPAVVSGIEVVVSTLFARTRTWISPEGPSRSSS